MRARLSPLLVAGLWIGCVAAMAAPGAASPVDAASPVRLVSPAAGATLVGGDTVELAWEPLPPFGDLARVEEWEAFLSLDGGVTYPLRLTPHLDQGLRRFAWRVPSFPTSDARLLFRFGDERRETPVRLPQSFAIVAPALPSPLGDGVWLLAHRALVAAGEPALPGQPGVSSWVEGSRQGGDSHLVVATGGARVGPGEVVELGGFRIEGLAPVRSPWQPGVVRELGAQTIPSPVARRAAGSAPPRPCPDLLLLTQRQNE